MIGLAALSPDRPVVLRTKLTAAQTYLRWSDQALKAAELAARSGNLGVEMDYTLRAAEYSRRALILSGDLVSIHDRQLEEMAEIYRRYGEGVER